MFTVYNCDIIQTCEKKKKTPKFILCLESFYLNMLKHNILFTGTQCSDSAECGVGLCCRGVFLFRFGKVNRCQKSDGLFMCIASDSFEY